MTSLWWIRRDLRLTDNAALQSGLRTGPVIPVFVLDPRLLRQASAPRTAFLFEGLRALRKDLESRGSGLVVRRGEPLEVLGQLTAETGAGTIHAEQDYTPYAHKRDARLAKFLPLELTGGQTVHPPELIVKSDGSPYTVYTPYARAWKAALPVQLEIHPAPPRFPVVGIPASQDIPWIDGGLSDFPAGEAEALRRLDRFMQNAIPDYAQERNRMDLEGTSSLSPYLRFGMLGLRQAVHAAMQIKSQIHDENGERSAEIWLNELIWREFYIQILHHFPHVARASFRPSLTKIRWNDHSGHLERWKQGETGVPVVDAAMHQLLETGWMHNRARMIVASYLVKDLLIDWRRGERWFMERLLDGDPASNNGGWQWVAGTGTDAAPYFRIFNPVLQSRKFDPHGNYIRKWVPELASLSDKEIHAPWESGIRARGYPARPLIDHGPAKERALQAYRAARSGVNSSR